MERMVLILALRKMCNFGGVVVIAEAHCST